MNIEDVIQMQTLNQQTNNSKIIIFIFLNLFSLLKLNFQANCQVKNLETCKIQYFFSKESGCDSFFQIQSELFEAGMET